MLSNSCGRCCLVSQQTQMSKEKKTMHQIPIECAIFVSVVHFHSYVIFRCVFFDRSLNFVSKVISTYRTLHLHKVRIRKTFAFVYYYCFSFLFHFFSLLHSFQLHSFFPFDPKCAIVLNHRPVIINLLYYCHRIVSTFVLHEIRSENRTWAYALHVCHFTHVSHLPMKINAFFFALDWFLSNTHIEIFFATPEIWKLYLDRIWSANKNLFPKQFLFLLKIKPDIDSSACRKNNSSLSYFRLLQYLNLLWWTGW